MSHAGLRRGLRTILYNSPSYCQRALSQVEARLPDKKSSIMTKLVFVLLLIHITTVSAFGSTDAPAATTGPSLAATDASHGISLSSSPKNVSHSRGRSASSMKSVSDSGAGSVSQRLNYHRRPECKLRAGFPVIYYGNCSVQARVMHCSGDCKTSTKLYHSARNSIVTITQMSDCHCCRQSIEHTRIIKVNCPHNRVVHVRVQEAQACECISCNQLQLWS